jgi:hypothetical protein
MYVVLYLKHMSQLQKSNLLRLRRRYTARNDCKDAICLCERSEAIPLLNNFAITSYNPGYNHREIPSPDPGSGSRNADTKH